MTSTKSRWEMTPKRKDALKLGERIRNIVCMDSIAQRYFEPHLQAIVRGVCDEQMHLLGYESLTEHKHRISVQWDNPELGRDWTNKDWDLFYKYHRLESSNAHRG